MSRKKLLIIVGTRPNFIKVSQFRRCNGNLGNPFDITILHTSQHNDPQMSGVFFQQIGLEPDICLEPSAGTPIARLAGMLCGLEKHMLDVHPDLVLVVGDVDSTFAGAWVANRLGFACAHVESGLRSGDRGMPEEINRILTDNLCDHYFVTEPSGTENLLHEGKLTDQIFFSGNTMIDTLIAFDPIIRDLKTTQALGLDSQEYLLMTMHRPATVDSKAGLENLADLIHEVTRYYRVVFPVHPRTNNNIRKFGLSDRYASIQGLNFTEPLDYFGFQSLILHAKAVITDSGGVQEETTFRGIPCLTLRPNTERPITIAEGTNVLVQPDASVIGGLLEDIRDGKFKKGTVPEGWDGQATVRILQACKQITGA